MQVGSAVLNDRVAILTKVYQRLSKLMATRQKSATQEQKNRTIYTISSTMKTKGGILRKLTKSIAPQEHFYTYKSEKVYSTDDPYLISYNICITRKKSSSENSFALRRINFAFLVPISLMSCSISWSMP
jgi:hypothetical protein